ncbi:MAG: formylmethanofuran dehydrogenase [Candidatus Methanoliparum thermophilum]|uniref:Formylmethanofuran dehydrogenase n=1 Tax=Methanoliparum thermophilum TaxID=2491083 RepID=A0A520KT28_METT2|nr:FmdE family protein [Candidatus Methanoliparum sp. LAM-1]RZN65083.1 MAG: formylmethanofuran dehydrogenase [Candidatus Methanoliparum thermophilum]BDC36024.1 formylmethanofuran dehydrogenase subunit E [Candidatus Methanoliparum sp. LAM-1]
MNEEDLKRQIDKVREFHGYLSSGAALGIPMLNYACEILGCNLDSKLFFTVESVNCLPDTMMALTKSTIGNKTVIIKDVGKFAITVSKKWGDKSVRVFVDINKLKKYPIIYDWFMNTKDISHEKVVPEILKAWTDILSYEVNDLKIPDKKKKAIAICEICREPFAYFMDDKDDIRKICKDCIDK